MSTCYAASRAGVLVVDIGATEADGDAAGVAAGPALTDHDVECLDAAIDVPERAFCGTFDAGLHRTIDGGKSWERVGSEPLPESVTSVTVAPHDPDVVYAGTEPSAVYRSTDGGDTWEELSGLTDLPSAPEWSFPPRPDTHHVRWVEVDPSDPDHLYVAVEAGALIQTHDGGDTWEERSPTTRRDTHSMAIHPDAPDRVRAAAGDGYAESDDAGRNWTFPQDGLKHRYCWSVAIDPGDPDRVLLSAAASARRAHTPERAASYLYRQDGSANEVDATWERLDDAGVPTGEGVLRPTLSGGTEAGELFALTDRGLYRTGDGGGAFERVEIEWPESFRERTTRGLAVV
ncbi:WD40/YVTN/BNR-like repeat-containing protein [Halobellus sp. EA9]|uniref:WD40/YVTN/BNR-like repeat-containing protein n=1 Tax=Halobellus sp. EA9 TaxID=3421647 RepID=UPI003EB80468